MGLEFFRIGTVAVQLAPVCAGQAATFRCANCMGVSTRRHIVRMTCTMEERRFGACTWQLHTPRMLLWAGPLIFAGLLTSCRTSLC
jgi:hypothetical protein